MDTEGVGTGGGAQGSPVPSTAQPGNPTAGVESSGDGDPLGCAPDGVKKGNKEVGKQPRHLKEIFHPRNKYLCPFCSP